MWCRSEVLVPGATCLVPPPACGCRGAIPFATRRERWNARCLLGMAGVRRYQDLVAGRDGEVSSNFRRRLAADSFRAGGTRSDPQAPRFACYRPAVAKRLAHETPPLTRRTRHGRGASRDRGAIGADQLVLCSGHPQVVAFRTAPGASSQSVPRTAPGHRGTVGTQHPNGTRHPLAPGTLAPGTRHRPDHFGANSG